MVAPKMAKTAQSALRMIDLETSDEESEPKTLPPKSRKKMALQGLAVFTVMFVVLYWFMSRSTD